MSSRKIFSAAFALLLAFASGCSPGGYFHHVQSGGQLVTVPLMPKRAAIAVSDTGLAEGGATSGWAYGLIPLMPFGRQTFESPEALIHGFESGRHVPYLEAQDAPDSPPPDGFDPDYVPYDLAWEMADTIQRDLAASNLFSELRYEYDGKYYTAESKSPLPYYTPEFKLDIEVKEMTWSRHPSFYGLSMGGAALWVLGLPVSYGTCRMVLAVEAVDVAGDELLWDKEYAVEAPCAEWLYWNWGADKSWSEALAKILAELRLDLKQNLPGMANKMTGGAEKPAAPETERQPQD